MGKSNKKRGEDIDWEELAGYEGDKMSQAGPSNNNESRGGADNGNKRNNGGNHHHQRMPQARTNVDFNPYLEVVDELKTQLEASGNALKKAHSFYTKQEQAIQEVVRTKQALEETTRDNEALNTTVKVLTKKQNENDEIYMSKVLEVRKGEQQLQRAKEKAEEDQRRFEEDKAKFKKEMRAVEAEQTAKLHEKQMKLEKEQNEQYKERVELLERETKERRDEDNKRIADLESENNNLLEKLEEQRRKLGEIESKFKDAETLKKVYEREAEELKESLKGAENEFELGTSSTDFYKKSFLEIYNDIQDISFRYNKELDISDLNKVHDKLKELDSGFTSVPISSSEISRKLCVAHTQRVISSQLQEIIWQPFSTEMTFEKPDYISLLSQISSKLAKPPGGLRVARVYTALTIRGLQSPLTSRAELFTNKVKAILSLIVKPSLHQNLQSDLFNLATSAVSLWNRAQTDQSDIIVCPTLDLANYEGWYRDPPTLNNGVIVLFPRITMREFSRRVINRPIGPPGMWVDHEPESHVQEICIHDGEGLEEWSELVLDGAEEEAERSLKQERERAEEEKRSLEEKIKKMNEPVGYQRRISQGRRESIAGLVSSPPSPSAMWTRSRQVIAETKD